ncbi:hypothetical protein HT136_01465 [Novosphingobium profundi]|uniref:DUF7940 domain-containing protein n=1 Tax=Novosphingobium profundi TaxID=1774954 RepID=UPI001BDACCED|nr:hypothetical protein [Novosphingobium profundi]MBT0667035.1 hypothetical protein [Novosphingobium profundi]
MMNFFRIHLVEDWRNSWRWASVRLSWLAGVLAFALMNMPARDIMAIADMIPPQWRPFARLVLSLLIAGAPHLARIVKKSGKGDKRCG